VDQRPAHEQIGRDRIDRELLELLNELRVALPGVQVLFAFLLILPFQAGFGKLDVVSTYVYFIGMLAAVTAIVLFIVPATYHRLTMRSSTPEKEEMLFTSSRIVLVGTAFLGTSLTCSLFVVTDVLFSTGFAIVVAIVGAITMVSLWYVLPIRRKQADPPAS
jgi:hypothetical protein